MRLFISIVLFLSSITLATAQKVYEVSSFYFSEPQPSSLPEVKEFDESVRGVYQLSTQKHTKLIVGKDSIISQYYLVFSVTQKDIDEKDQLYIENNLLYGIAEQGLPFVKENDTLLVALNQREVFCTTKNCVVKFNKGVYYINEKVGENRWKTTILEMDSKSIVMQEFNHDLAEKELSKLPRDVEYDEGMKVFIATPSDKDFYTIAKSKGYSSDKIVYKREKK